MKYENAIEFLKRLHELEKEFSDDLFASDKKELVEQIRADFIKHYKG